MADTAESETTTKRRTAASISSSSAHRFTSSGHGAEIIVQHDAGVTRLRTVDLSLLLNPLGEVEVAIGQLVDAHAYGDSVVLIGALWEDNPHYRVALVDISTPAAPQVLETLTIAVTPYSVFWGPWPPIPLPIVTQADTAAVKTIAPGPRDSFVFAR